MFKIKFNGNGATSGKMSMKEYTKKGKLPSNQFKRKGYKFVGWSLKKNNVINMKHFQLGKVKYKNRAAVNFKNGKTITLYACWKGYGPEAACLWARLITRDNSFMYGVGNGNWYHGRDRAHQIGCYFCGTTVHGPKRAKRGDRWEKTYCCNSFVMAAFTHGANMFKKCAGGSTKYQYWLKIKVGGKPIFKYLGRNVKYSDLNPGDILLSGTHIKLYVGKVKGVMKESHAAGEGWNAKSIRTQKVSGRIGNNYVALKYIGRH